MAAGRLLWYSAERGYGLVQPDLGGPPQVVTRADLPCPTRRQMASVRTATLLARAPLRAVPVNADQAPVLVPA